MFICSKLSFQVVGLVCFISSFIFLVFILSLKLYQTNVLLHIMLMLLCAIKNYFTLL